MHGTFLLRIIYFCWIDTLTNKRNSKLKDYKKLRKLKKINYLQDIISNSKKTYIIYKSLKGFDLYTDFSKRIILTNRNIINFINKTNKKKTKIKDTDLYLGFFGYEILNNLIGVKIKNKKV